MSLAPILICYLLFKDSAQECSFFVLSGFLVSISFERCMASGEGVRGLLIRRFAKIFPLYLIFLNLNIFLYLMAEFFAPDVVPFRNSVTSQT
jgi:peptidoglycan/LPS O-acetylase OafA/YrhL